MKKSFFALFACAFFTHAETYRAVDLGDLGVAHMVAANALNNNGVVVGWATAVVDPKLSSVMDRAFIWDSTNGIVQLGSLGGSSMATAISDTGIVAGFARTDRTGDFYTGVFFKPQMQIERFSDTNRFKSFEVMAMNKRGEILCN